MVVLRGNEGISVKPGSLCRLRLGVLVGVLPEARRHCFVQVRHQVIEQVDQLVASAVALGLLGREPSPRRPCRTAGPHAADVDNKLDVTS